MSGIDGPRGQMTSGGPAKLARSIVHELDALPERKTAPMRVVRRTYSRILNPESGEFVFNVADAIVEGRRYRWIADELVANHRGAFASLNASKLERLGRTIDSWDTVDSFARALTGPAWLDGLIHDSTVRRWARSKDRWWRRAALVSTVALNSKSQGGQGDAARTLAIGEMLVDDHNDMTEKALSWALRALVPYDRKSVEHFLNKHADRVAARVKREVRNKLRTGYKNP